MGGFRPTEEELKELLLEIDEDGSGEIEFGEFCQLCATFLVEDPDIETMKRELKDAFRIYDKEGLGYITTETLRGLIGELLAPLTDEELDGILEELDEDGSGSMDFDEFCEMMMTKPEWRERERDEDLIFAKHKQQCKSAVYYGAKTSCAHYDRHFNWFDAMKMRGEIGCLQRFVLQTNVASVSNY